MKIYIAQYCQRTEISIIYSPSNRHKSCVDIHAGCCKTSRDGMMIMGGGVGHPVVPGLLRVAVLRCGPAATTARITLVSQTVLRTRGAAF